MANSEESPEENFDHDFMVIVSCLKEGRKGNYNKDLLMQAMQRFQQRGGDLSVVKSEIEELENK